MYNILSYPFTPPIIICILKICMILLYIYLINTALLYNNNININVANKNNTIYIIMLLLCLIYCTMYKCVFTDPGSIKSHNNKYNNTQQQVKYNKYNNDYDITTTTTELQSLTSQSFRYLLISSNIQTKYNGTRRYCRKCLSYKPDRTYHCTIHNQCILRFDHCCSILNNDIGIYNYKFFILYLLYIDITSYYMLYTLILYNALHWFNLYTHTFYCLLTVYYICIITSLSIGLTLFLLYHILLITYNITSVEYNEYDYIHINSIHKYVFNRYNSVYDNFCSIFGNNMYLWLLPIQSHIHYSNNKNLYCKAIKINKDYSNSDNDYMLELVYNKPDYGIVYR